MVVSDKEESRKTGQVGIWETNASELLMNASRALHDEQLACCYAVGEIAMLKRFN